MTNQTGTGTHPTAEDQARFLATVRGWAAGLTPNEQALVACLLTAAAQAGDGEGRTEADTGGYIYPAPGPSPTLAGAPGGVIGEDGLLGNVSIRLGASLARALLSQPFGRRS